MLFRGASHYLYCLDCGGYYARGGEHTCDEERMVAFQMMKFATDWVIWRGTKQGRFEIFYAERNRGW